MVSKSPQKKTVAQVSDQSGSGQAKFDESLVKYAFYSLASSIVLGLLFVYLFVWEAPALSHFIFYLAVFTNSLIPIFAWNRNLISKNKKSFVSLLVIMGATSLSSLWVRNTFALFISVLALPTVYAMSFSIVHAGEKLPKLSIWRLFTWPLILFVSWFGDLPAYIRHLRPSYIKNSKFGYYGARVLLGLFIASPFILTFILLLSSADALFQDFVSNIISKTFGRWFADFESFVIFVGKFFVAIAVGVYFSVYNFSLWNQRSALAKSIRRSIESKESIISKTWNVVTTSSFLFFINLVFVTFVIVQSTYLFSGDSNVIGSNAEFTYSEYARRGFLELVIVSGLVYLIGIILGVKVKTTTEAQKLLFRVNFMVLILSAVVVSISSQMRLFLVESVYGFTVVRLWGHVFTAMIAILLALLLVAMIAKNSQRFISRSILYLFITFNALIILLPIDNFVANLNYRRYQNTGKIDIVYMLNLSTEASPVWFKIAKDSTTTSLISNAVNSNIHSRASESSQDSSWFEWNIWSSYMKGNVEELSSTQQDSEKALQESLLEFIDGYESSLVGADYESAYTDYWSDITQPVDLNGLQSYKIVSYGLSDESSVDAESFLRYPKSFTAGNSYWDGIYLSANLYFTSGSPLNKCLTDTIRVRVENGEWKIVSSSYLPLGEDQSLNFGRIDSENPFSGLENVYTTTGCD